MNIAKIRKYAKAFAHTVCVCLYALLASGLALDVVYGGIAVAYLILLSCDLHD